MFAQPGKKLLFMGDEFGQVSEWSHDRSLDWNVLQYPVHSGLMAWVGQLNHLYSREPAMHWFDNDPRGFEWVDCNDAPASVVSLLRKGQSADDCILIVCNFTPVPRLDYMVGVPTAGYWKELLNSDAQNMAAAASATWEAPRLWPSLSTVVYFR